MKKLFAILLSLVMLISLAACTPSGGGKPSIVGTWTGSVNMGAMLETLMQTEVEKDISCKMIFTFSADGKIYIAESQEDLDEEDYDSVYIVSLAGNTLTVTDIESDGESAAEIMPDMFPLVFKK